MSTLRVNGSDLYYEDHGPKDAPAIVLSPLLFANTTIYEPIVRMLSDDFRVIVFDNRGTGRSAGPAPKSLEESGRDVAALIEKLEIQPCHFVGNCLGSFIGLNLAVSRSDLLKSCVLMGASADAAEDAIVKHMDEFIDNGKKNGLKDSVDEFTTMWFGSTFKATKDPIQVTRRERVMKDLAKVKPEVVETARQLFHRKDINTELSKVRCEMLIVAGDEDSPEALEAYQKLVKGISGAELKLIHHAGYALVVEQPEEVAEIIRNFCHKVDRHWAQKSKQVSRDLGASAM